MGWELVRQETAETFFVFTFFSHTVDLYSLSVGQ